MDKTDFSSRYDELSQKLLSDFGKQLKENASPGIQPQQDVDAYFISQLTFFIRDYVKAVLEEFLPLSD